MGSLIPGEGRGFPRILLVLGTALAVSCSTRDHDNPLDPENESTGGRPRWLEALADEGAVDLRWRVPGYDDLVSVELIDESTAEALWTGKAGEVSYRHEDLPNHELRTYRLDLFFDTPDSIRLPSQSAEPGPAVAWVLDAGSGRATRVTPDARAVRFTLPVVDAASLRVEPDSGSVAVADFFGGAVHSYAPDGRLRWINRDVEHPSDVEASPGGWWVGDPVGRVVVWIDDAGTTVYGDTLSGTPVLLAVVSDLRVWVAEERGPVLLVERGTGVIARLDEPGVPGALAPGPDGGVWISDLVFDRVRRLDEDASVVFERTGMPGIVSMTPDPGETGAVWLSDRGRGSLVRLAPDGTETESLEAVVAPSRIAVSPDGSEIWVADPGASALLRLARDGTVLVRAGQFSSPITVAVAFEPAPPAAAPR